MNINVTLIIYSGNRFGFSAGSNQERTRVTDIGQRIAKLSGSGPALLAEQMPEKFASSDYIAEDAARVDHLHESTR